MKKIILAVIIFLALFLRLYGLDKNPPSLNWDEISHGYNAYSILKTGRDEWGQKFPLIFRAYGDYKLPLYIYLTVIPEAIFGLNSFSVRLISVLSGFGLVLLAYFICKKISEDETVALIAAFLTALSPWGLFLSRVAVEANLGAFLFALGMYFLVIWLKNNGSKSLIFTFLFWGLSLYAYNSARILVPIFSALVFLYIFRIKKIKRLFFPVILLALFSIPLLTQLFSKSATARFSSVSIIDEGAVNTIIRKRSESKLPALITRAFYNRPVYFISNAIKNYFSNLSPKYLFFSGGSHYQFSLPDHEILYLVMAPFLIIGLFLILIKGSLSERILFLWFFLAFIPSAITRDAPHVLRSLFILPSPMIISAFGIKYISEKIIKTKLFGINLLIFVFVICTGISFFRWWSDYQTIYPKYYSWAWQDGYKEAVLFVKENYSGYDKIFFTKRYGEPHEFLLFYFPWSPSDYQTKNDKNWDYHADWYWVNSFDKFEFINDWEVVQVKCQMLNGKCLLITSPGNFPKGWTKIKTINYSEGKPVFEIFELSTK